MPRPRIPPDAPTSRRDEAAAGWYAANRVPQLGRWVEDLLDRRHAKWDTLSWTTVRALADSANDVIAHKAPAIIRERRRRYVAAQRASGAERMDAGPPTPGYGSFGPDFVIDWTGLAQPRFLILGDPGESDASQYAVMEPLEGVHAGGAEWERDRRAKSDFLVVLSDVMYPAGDVNDYPNGFYLPLHRYDRPVYALPGNHDWYDGLSGFMYHFCHAQPLPRMNLSGRSLRFGERVVRMLWRRASRPDCDRLAPLIAERSRLNLGRAGHPPALERAPDPLYPVQPSPYFAIELDELLLVAIDTGVDGDLDAEQARWLLRVSSRPKPKVLLTGKPLWSDGEHRPGAITWDASGEAGDPRFHTVDDVVRHPPHNYIAAVGGDTHNYQRYPVRTGGRPIEYVVAGGGGAYLGATHAIPLMDLNGPCAEEAFRCYPLRGDSLALFCRRMGPLLFKSLLTTLLVVGAACALLFGVVEIGADRVRAAAGAAAGVCGLGLVTAACVAFAGRAPTLRGAGQRLLLVLAAGAAAVGMLLAFNDHRVTAAAVVALATPLAVLAGVVVAYLGRGNLPRQAVDWLPVVPLLALAPALWAPYDVGAAGAALLYGLAPLTAALVAVSLVSALRPDADGDTARARMFRALTALLWAALAAVVVVRFGQPWMWRSLLVVAALFVVVGVVVPLLGPRQRVRQPRHDTIGSAAGTVVVISAAGLALVGVHALFGEQAAAVIAAGVAALAGVVAASCALYLLVWLRLADPRATWRLRTGAITPAGAAEFAARKHGWDKSTTRDIDPAEADARRRRMVEVIWRLGQRVSPVADTDDPPFFKSFLSAEVRDGALELRTYGVTGYRDKARAPSLEDRVQIPLEPPRVPLNDVHSLLTPAG
jgi:hypothetical protein